MRSVILFQPMMGYYDKVARDLPAALLSVASYIHDKYEVIIIDQRVPEWKERLDVTKKMFKVGYPAIDTCALAYIYLPTERQNLNALREHFDISTDRAHSADTDVVVAAAQAYVNALNRLVSSEGSC